MWQVILCLRRRKEKSAKFAGKKVQLFWRMRIIHFLQDLSGWGAFAHSHGSLRGFQRQ